MMDYNAPNNTPNDRAESKRKARIQTTPELDRLIIQYAQMFKPWDAPYGERSQRWVQVYTAIRQQYEDPLTMGTVRSVRDRWRVLQRRVDAPIQTDLLGTHGGELEREIDSQEAHNELLQIHKEMLMLQRRQVALMEEDLKWKQEMVQLFKRLPN
jgi:hypothetical protein